MPCDLPCWVLGPNRLHRTLLTAPAGFGRDSIGFGKVLSPRKLHPLLEGKT